MKFSSVADIVILALAAAAPQLTGADAAPTAAPSLPHGRAGYWEVKITGAGGRTSIRHTCSDGSPPNLNGPMARYCRVNYARTASSVVGDGTCAMNGITGTSHLVARGDFDTAYTIDSTGAITMPGRPPMSFRSHVDAHWVGACPAGMKPGDSSRS